MTQYVKTYSCPTCGNAATGRGHLCHPRQDAPPYVCEFCSKSVSDARHVCASMLDNIEYTCKKCGRLAIYDSMLCEPEPIDED
ncbi:MAG: hypothetical protein HZB83_02405 [Deltaproteobacteria bacterium]|nr:hypothetical protein [Deltaproteobacteria bacterium]